MSEWLTRRLRRALKPLNHIGPCPWHTHCSRDGSLQAPGADAMSETVRDALYLAAIAALLIATMLPGFN